MDTEHTTKQHCVRAEKIRQCCRACADLKKKGQGAGIANPFYGHKHTDETRAKFKKRDLSYRQEDWYRELMSKATAGDKNPMAGRSVYEVWVEKYGKEEADKRKAAWLVKQKANSTGERNPMYGKPSPQGSGVGWKGWYRGLFFRSLKELSYMVDLDEQKVVWVSGESLSIPYIDPLGTKRTYRPDFLVGLRMVEIKPTKLKASRVVRLKQAAAETYCVEHGLLYEMVDPKLLAEVQIKALREAGLVKFTERYEAKFIERCGGKS
jgi:hypothetical protein